MTISSVETAAVSAPTERIERISAAAYRIRHHALNMGEVQGQGYVGQALGAADMLAAVYADQLNYRAEDPHWADRDRFLLSTGHYAIGHYAALAEAGIVPVSELETYGSDDSRLPMSGMSTYTPGMEISGGSLGHGLTIAVGMALGLREQNSTNRVFNFLSDGELDEGSTWEAAMGAHHHQLGNLTAMVDINALQADGDTDTVLRTEPVTEKWESFGWYTQRVDGNDVGALLAAFDNAAAQGGAARRTAVGDSLRHQSWPRRAAAGGPRKGALHAHRRKRMADLPRAADRRIRREGFSMSTTTTAKPKLKTSAMIASFADPGQKTTSAPFGHALVKAAQENDKIVGPHRGPGQVHGHAHLRQGVSGAVLPDGHGRAAPLRRGRGHGRNRDWSRSRPPTRCSLPAAPTTSCAWTSRNRT